jgi:hypothetical protein
MKDSVISLHEDEGYRTGIVVSVGPKFIGVIYPDSSGIRIRKIKKDAANITVMDYPVNRAKKMLRKCGKNFGITKGAKTALRP